MTVLPQDLQKVLVGVSLQELNEQIRVGNAPSQILVDGRAVGRRNIVEAKRKVSMRFADTNILIKAAQEAYDILQVITRVESPPKNTIVARQNFHLWLDGASLGILPGALARLNPGNLKADSVLRVVGPLVPYGRKLYWRPVGRGTTLELTQRTSVASGRSRFVYNNRYQPRFRPYSLRSVRRLANQAGGDKAERLRELIAKKPGYTEGAGQIVKRIMRKNRLFSALYISDGWVKYGPAKSWGKKSKDDKVPSISVQLAKKGNVRVINL